jgi:hypothetical protein
VTTVSEWAERAATLPAALVQATPRAVRTSADILQAQARTNVAQATGGDLRLSRVRSGKGAAIALRVRTVGSGSRTRAEVVPTGPIMLVERDTKAHQLRSRAGGRGYSMARRRSASRRGFLYIPGVGYRASAKHPGTKGKEPVGRAFAQSAPEAGTAGSLVFQQAIRSHLSS